MPLRTLVLHWEEIKISTLTEVWKKSIPALTDNFKRVETSVGKVTADVVQIAQELEVESEDVIDLLQSHDKALMVEELLLDKQRRWFFATWNLLLVKML